MKVRITKMRYIEGQGRVRPGAIIEWPHKELGRGMVPADTPVETPAIDGRRKGAKPFYTQPVAGAKPAPVEVREFVGRQQAEVKPEKPQSAKSAEPAKPAKPDSNEQVL